MKDKQKKRRLGKFAKLTQHTISQSIRTSVQQAWVEEALAGDFRRGSAVRLRRVAAKARSVRQQLAEECMRRRNEVRSGKIKPISANEVYRRIERLFAK